MVVNASILRCKGCIIPPLGEYIFVHSTLGDACVVVDVWESEWYSLRLCLFPVLCN
jgi:hypothetical protein